MPYGEIPEEIEPILNDTKAQITPIFPDQDYCGVGVENGWVLYDGSKQAGTNNNLSFKTAKIATASNLKAVKINDNIINF